MKLRQAKKLALRAYAVGPSQGPQPLGRLETALRRLRQSPWWVPPADRVLLTCEDADGLWRASEWARELHQRFRRPLVSDRNQAPGLGFPLSH